MPTATYQLVVDWNADGVFTAAGENITGRLLNCDWQRGRDFASQLQGRSVAGELTARLDNRSGDYSSFLTTGPLYGSMLPGRKIKLRTTAPTAVDLWTGYLETITPINDVKGYPQVELRGIGALGRINQQEVSVPMVTTMLTGSVIGTILTRAGWAAADSSLSTGDTTIDRFWSDQVQTILALRKVEEAESGFIYEGASGNIIFHNRHRRMVTPYTTSQGTFTDGTGSLLYRGLNQEDPLQYIYNDFRASVQTYSTLATGTLWAMQATGTVRPQVLTGEASTLWANYPNPTSTIGAIGVDTWVTPTSTVDYKMFSDTDGTGTDLTTAISAAFTKFGNSMKMVFTNTGTIDCYVTLLQARGVALLANDPVTISKEDATSQTSYGQRRFPTEPAFIPNLSEADNWCRFNLSVYKDPVPILTLTVDANRNSSLLTQVLIREISDRITVVATGSRAKLGIGEDFFVETMHHHLAKGNIHTVTYSLSQAKGYSDFWVLDFAALGTQTRLAY